MTTILILFLAGIGLLAADLFLLSVVLAAAGGVAMAIATIQVYSLYGVMPAVISGSVAVLLTGAAIYAEVVYLPRTRLGHGLVVESISGAAPSPPAPTDALMGRPALAVTTLAPSGYVEIEGRRYEAFCQSGHVRVGEILRVIGLDSFRVIVTRPAPTSAS